MDTCDFGIVIWEFLLRLASYDATDAHRDTDIFGVVEAEVDEAEENRHSDESDIEATLEVEEFWELFTGMASGAATSETFAFMG